MTLRTDNRRGVCWSRRKTKGLRVFRVEKVRVSVCKRVRVLKELNTCEPCELQSVRHFTVPRPAARHERKTIPRRFKPAFKPRFGTSGSAVQGAKSVWDRTQTVRTQARDG